MEIGGKWCDGSVSIVSMTFGGVKGGITKDNLTSFSRDGRCCLPIQMSFQLVEIQSLEIDNIVETMTNRTVREKRRMHLFSLMVMIITRTNTEKNFSTRAIVYDRNGYDNNDCRSKIKEYVRLRMDYFAFE